jgi:DUF1365 family protein
MLNPPDTATVHRSMELFKRILRCMFLENPCYGRHSYFITIQVESESPLLEYCRYGFLYTHPVLAFAGVYDIQIKNNGEVFILLNVQTPCDMTMTTIQNEAAIQATSLKQMLDSQFNRLLAAACGISCF